MTKVNDEKLTAAVGGVKGPTSKYDLGQKVRYIDYTEEVLTGVIFDEVLNGEDLTWSYLINDTNGNFRGSYAEERILGTV